MKHAPASMSRRRFIGQSACSGLGLTGLLSTLGTLRLFNATLSAQGVPDGDDSKALICLFLFGGNDSNNTLVPRDLPSYDAYQTDRGILALARDSLLPIANPGGDGREFGLHPAMAPLLPADNAGDMAILCNVGTLVAPIFPRKHPRIDAQGRLLDAWGKPFVFHPLGSQHLEVLSCGPDGGIFTSDDIRVPPPR